MKSNSFMFCFVILLQLTHKCNALMEGLDEKTEFDNGEIVQVERSHLQRTRCPAGHSVCRLHQGRGDNMCCSCVDWYKSAVIGQAHTLECSNECRAYTGPGNGIFTSVYCCTCLELSSPLSPTAPPPVTYCPAGDAVCRLNRGWGDDMCCSCVDWNSRVTSVQKHTLAHVCTNECRAYTGLVHGIYSHVYCCTCLDLVPPLTPPPPSTTPTTTTTTTTPPPPPPSSTPPPSGPACFPSTARVNLENGRSVSMSELQTGDHVQIDGDIIHSEVRTFLKKQHAVTTIYKTITTSWNTVTLSPDHLIFARKSSDEVFIPIHASKVLIGDDVLVQGNDELTQAKVINISSITKQGAYTPVTMEGNIMVDGVLASCYSSTHHDSANLAMTPIKWFPEMIQQIIGENSGVKIFVNIADEFGKWMPPHGNTQ